MTATEVNAGMMAERRGQRVKRGIIATLVLSLGLAACAHEDAIMFGPRGPRGERITLEEARRIAPYGILLPEYLPRRMGLEAVLTSRGTPDRLQILLQYDDGTFIEFLPRQGTPDYEGIVQSLDRGRVISVRGTNGFAEDAAGRPSFVRWFERGLEIVIQGPHPSAELLRMAESLREAH